VRGEIDVFSLVPMPLPAAGQLCAASLLESLAIVFNPLSIGV
jgi:hypothetical protein